MHAFDELSLSLSPYLSLSLANSSTWFRTPSFMLIDVLCALISRRWRNYNKYHRLYCDYHESSGFLHLFLPLPPPPYCRHCQQISRSLCMNVQLCIVQMVSGAYNVHTRQWLNWNEWIDVDLSEITVRDHLNNEYSNLKRTYNFIMRSRNNFNKTMRVFENYYHFRSSFVHVVRA